MCHVIFTHKFSGFDEIMPPHRIRAVLGLHAISEFKNKVSVNDNTVDGPIESPYEIQFRNIVVHPKYECKRPDNDIGKDNFLFLCLPKRNQIKTKQKYF